MRRLCFALLLPLFVLGDHLPDRLIASDRPEHIMCGIDVYQTKAPAVLERFGKPNSDETYPKTEEARELAWEREGARIHATVNVGNIAYAVNVRGKPNSVTKTGRGLGLGARRGQGLVRREGRQVTAEPRDRRNIPRRG